METVQTAIAYAEEVASGEVVAGRLTRLACERFLRDLGNTSRDWPWVLDEERAERVHRFLARLKHVEGPKAGQLFKLEPWQVFIITNLFGWVHQETELRRFLYGYIEIARGNGKSMLLSGIGLYLAFASGVIGARVYSAANSEDQSRIVYDTAKTIVERQPELQRALGLIPEVKRIKQPHKNAEFRPLPGIPRDGKRVYGALFDELHEAKDQAQWNSLTQSMGKIPDAIAIAATTAGYDLSSFCYRLRSDVVAILEDKIEDDRTFGIIYGMDADDDWRSDTAIVKANPNLHVSVQLDTILAERERARRDPWVEYTYKTKRLNLWVHQQTGYYDLTAWHEAAKPDLDILALPGATWYLGGDLASKEDLSAVVACCEHEGTVYVWSHFWVPEAAVDRYAEIPYRVWAEHGHCTITPGAVTDYDYIEKSIVDLARRLKAKIFAFDPFNATQLAVHLRKRGIQVIELPTTVRTMTEPMAESSALLASRRLVHSGNPIMDLHVANTVAYVDRGGRLKPEKPKDPGKKIDGVVAWLNALSRIMAARVEPKGVRRLIA